MVKLDTLSKMEKIQIEILKKMPPEKRLELSLELTKISLKLLEEGIRKRNPNYTEREVKQAIKKILLGEDTFKLVYKEDIKL
ncbi:MAG: hypothetical protein ABIK78_02715 [candidate division WOR-3 bacterium]